MQAGRGDPGSGEKGGGEKRDAAPSRPHPRGPEGETGRDSESHAQRQGERSWGRRSQRRGGGGGGPPKEKTRAKQGGGRREGANL